MHTYVQHVVLFLKRFLGLLILYSASRLFFYILNAGYFSDISNIQVMSAFVSGIRFDIAAIAFTNVVFVLLLLPGGYKNNRQLQKTGNVLFFAINAFALMGNFIDAKFFDFINKRSTSSIFSLMGANRDVWLMIPRFMVDYWYVALTWIFVMLVFWRWMPRLRYDRLTNETLTLKNVVFQSLAFLALSGLILWGARGTRLKPIGIIDAAAHTELKVVPLVLNTPFSILKTLENENLVDYQFYPEDTLKKYCSTIHHYVSTFDMKKMNIVVVILESFSKEYSAFLNDGEGYTPNLDSLLRHSMVFENAFANGTQSYEALPAIIAGIPSWMDRPYSGSNYSDNVIESLPSILGKTGYHTSFFHGGNNGTMGFDNFAHAAGIANYYGRDEYNNEADYDRHWGIWDEPFLQYFARQVNTFPQPFFTAVFTLSSHHPYNIPGKYKNRFTDETLPILKSVKYADFALGEFFKTARQMPWYNNTLFVFTADHAAQSVEKIYNSTTGMYAIPIAFYCPSDTALKGIDNTIGQQIDIMPTVLDYIEYKEPFFAFGASLLQPDMPHRAVSFVNGIYQLVESDYVMLFDGREVTSFHTWKQQVENVDIDTPEPLDDAQKMVIYRNMENSIKAIIQTYNNCLIRNRTTFQQNRDSLVQNPFEIQGKHLP